MHETNMKKLETMRSITDIKKESNAVNAFSGAHGLYSVDF